MQGVGRAAVIILRILRRVVTAVGQFALILLRQLLISRVFRTMLSTEESVAGKAVTPVNKKSTSCLVACAFER